MENKNNNKNNKFSLIIIIVILIVLLLLCLIISKKSANNNIELENKKIIKENNYIEDALHITKKGKYTGYCSAGLTHFLDIDVSYPKIKLKKDNAYKLNDLILEENKKGIDFILEDNIDILDNKNKTSLYIYTSYDYIVKNNTLYIYLETKYTFSNNQEYVKKKNYYYDIKNDKIIDFEEAIKNTQFNLDDFKDKDKNNIIHSFKDCNKGKCGLEIKDNKLIPYISE